MLHNRGCRTGVQGIGVSGLMSIYNICNIYNIENYTSGGICVTFIIESEMEG